MDRTKALLDKVIPPWLMISGPFVPVAILGFNFMGDGQREAADPYSIRR